MHKSTKTYIRTLNHEKYATQNRQPNNEEMKASQIYKEKLGMNSLAQSGKFTNEILELSFGVALKAKTIWDDVIEKLKYQLIGWK